MKGFALAFFVIVTPSALGMIAIELAATTRSESHWRQAYIDEVETSNSLRRELLARMTEEVEA